eukprot:2408567-Prymnesium_polylepis.2
MPIDSMGSPGAMRTDSHDPGWQKVMRLPSTQSAAGHSAASASPRAPRIGSTATLRGQFLWQRAAARTRAGTEERVRRRCARAEVDWAPVAVMERAVRMKAAELVAVDEAGTLFAWLSGVAGVVP